MARLSTTTLLLLAAGAYMLLRSESGLYRTMGGSQNQRSNTIAFPIGGTAGGPGIPWETAAIQGAVQLGTAAINKIPWGDIFGSDASTTWPVSGGDFYL